VVAQRVSPLHSGAAAVGVASAEDVLLGPGRAWTGFQGAGRASCRRVSSRMSSLSAPRWRWLTTLARLI